MDDSLLKSIAGKYGTPLYVYDGDLVLERCRQFKNAFKGFPVKVKFCYAVKANTSLAILKLIQNQGFGADVVSAGELDAALNAGFKPSDIIYTSNSKSDEDIKAAVKAKINITIDNAAEIEAVEKAGGRKVAFRVNPDVDAKTHPKVSTALSGSKFGLHFTNDIAFNAVKKAVQAGLQPVGIHCHIGSNIKDATAFTEAAGKMMDFAVRLKKELDIKLDFIDFGGGLGVQYKDEIAFTPEQFAGAYKSAVAEGVKKLGYAPEAWFEPGRFIVAEAGIVLAKVNNVKETPAKKFVNVDCGFNVLVRPAMYDAYHKVGVVGKNGEQETYDIAGYLCESGDILAKDRALPKVVKGDLIKIQNAGAYGFSMASNYNSQPLPAEVLVKGGKAHLIRKRQTIKDLYERQLTHSDL
ncbi:MAG: diaminopimelate decarboxylase [Candidatus Altiarchaeota archaeon]|nr:diaminopimelate decarboxylase [Candidatus Altiarchaeota archaeon]